MSAAPFGLAVFEDAGWRDLLPLTWARATFELRCGIDTLLDKVVAAVVGPDGTCAGEPLALFVRPELADVIAERHARASVGSVAPDRPTLFVNGRLLQTATIRLTAPSACWLDDVLLAAWLPADRAARLAAADFLDSARLAEQLRDVPRVDPAVAFGTAAGGVGRAAADRLIRHPWNLIARNAGELARQIAAMPARQDGRIDAGVHLLNAAAIRIGAGARIKPGAVLDAEDGPIHVGANVIISPHVSLKGPCSVGDGSLVQPGAAIREGVSIGPTCKVGGEIEGSIFQGFANKQHDGFLGHSYIAAWVNLGADTVTSDLKNTYGTVTVPLNGRRVDSGERFLGSIIGEHSKTGICTALTTGTIIGFCANVVASRPPQFVPSFTWLTPAGAESYDVDRAVAVARTVMSRRKRELSVAEELLMRRIAAESRRIEDS